MHPKVNCFLFPFYPTPPSRPRASCVSMPRYITQTVPTVKYDYEVLNLVSFTSPWLSGEFQSYIGESGFQFNAIALLDCTMCASVSYHYFTECQYKYVEMLLFINHKEILHCFHIRRVKLKKIQLKKERY